MKMDILFEFKKYSSFIHDFVENSKFLIVSISVGDEFFRFAVGRPNQLFYSGLFHYDVA